MEINKYMQNHKFHKGQDLVEFALILPVLLLLIFGIIEAGRLLFMYSTATLSSREAVRYGSAVGEVSLGTSFYEDCTGISNAAQRVGGLAGMTFDNVNIKYDHGPGSGSFASCPLSGELFLATGDRIVVQVDTNWSPLLGIIPGFQIQTRSSRTIMYKVTLK